MIIPNYQIDTTIHKSRFVSVVRGRRLSDNTPVVVKIVPSLGAGQLRMARVRYEFAAVRDLNHLATPYIPQALELLELPEGVAFIMVDIGAMSLSEVRTHIDLSLPQIVAIGCAVARALVSVHRARIVHKDISPNNIVYNHQSGAVELIDFGIASRLGREFQAHEPLAGLEGTPAYIAPEQTGRMNRPVDYRSDFYSLGATLYDCIAGEVPFKAQTLTEVLHAVITRVPTDLRRINPTVPTPLAELIAKLLQKDPDARYKSAHGLHTDLVAIATALQQGRSDINSKLGSADRDERFSLSDKLYGRHHEIDALLKAYADVAHGAYKIVAIGGPSGSGKSSLMREIQPNLLAHATLFGAGKHAQFERHLPFSALSQALNMVVEQILKEPEALLENWRRRILSAVGNIGQAAVGIVPSLELVLGHQKPLMELAPRETENRLLTVLSRLLSALAQHEPLVIFLDDLQWADPGTLRLIQMLGVTMRTGARALLVGAFRDNEVGPGHPFAKLLEDLTEQKRAALRLQITPLQVADVQAMLEDATGVKNDPVTQLATLLHAKVSGNPFFLHALIAHLNDHNLLRYETTSGAWQWSVEDIEAASIPPSAGGLMVEKLGRLAPAQRDVVATAALLGDSSDLDLLTEASGNDADRVLAALRDALQLGLMIPVGHAHRYADLMGVGTHATGGGAGAALPLCRFAHDQVRQAAYEILDKEQAEARHFLLAQLLLQRYDARPTPQRILALLEQLNRVIPAAVAAGLARRVIELNLAGAQEVKRALAYAVALDYVRIAAKVLGPNAWADDYHLSRSVYMELAELETLQGNSEAARGHLRQLLERSTTAEERAHVYLNEVVAAAALGKYGEALTLGQAGLAALGYRFPIGDPWYMRRKLLELAWTMRNKDAFMLANLPPCTNKRAELAQAIYSTMIFPAFIHGTTTYASLIVTMVTMSITFGNTARSAMGYACLAVVYTRLNDYRRARQYRRLTQTCIENLPNTGGLGFIWFALSGWAAATEPAAALHDGFEKGRQLCQEEGDFIYGAFCGTCLISLMLSNSLDVFEEEYKVHHAFITQKRQPASLLTMQVYRQAALCLRGETPSPHSLDSIDFKVADAEAYVAEHPFDTATTAYLIVQTIVSWLHEDPASCTGYALRGLSARVPQMQVETVVVPYLFYGALGLIDAAQQGQSLEHASLRIIQHKLGLILDMPGVPHGLPLAVKAHLASHEGRLDYANRAFTKACALLAANDQHQWVASAHECAARHFAAAGQSASAMMHALEARRRYRLGGALHKLLLLKTRFGELFTEANAMLDGMRSSTDAHTSTGSQPMAFIEMQALIRASQAISREVNGARVVQAALTGMSELAGATRASLLLLRNGQLEVAADTRESATALPELLLAYVLRSKKALIIQDARKSKEIADLGLSQGDARAVLVAPILHQAETRGVMYLENNVAPNTFTDKQLDLLQVLATQAAIALANAHSYSHLEDEVARRTEDLRKAHDRLIQLEKQSTESQLAGGFAHEMRNALSGPGYCVASLMPNAGSAPGTEPSIIEDNERILRALDSTVSDLAVEPASQHSLTEGLRELRANNDAMVDAVKMIDAGVERGLRITTQVLDYAEASAIIPGADAVSIKSICDKIYDSMADEFQRQNIQCTVTVEPTAAVFAEEQHVCAMLRNLMANARDALSATQSRERLLRISAVSHQGRVTVQVEDSGCGMTDAVRMRIFQPFFTTKGTAGTGLGLGLTRKLVAVYGGRLNFLTQEGTGTTFTLDLPAAPSR